MDQETACVTLADQVRSHGRNRGERPAFICGERRTSFAEFDRVTSQVANALIAEGLGSGGRFAFLCRNTDRVFELFYGAHKAACVPVGVNWRLAVGEIRYILRDSGARLIFTDLDGLSLCLEAASQVPSVTRILLLDAPETVCGEGSVAHYLAWRDAHGDTDPARDHGMHEVACQLYTSGTTGNPKGVLLSHDNFLAQRRAEADTGPWMNARPEGVVLVVMPTYHVGGLCMGTTSFSQGATTVVSANPDAASLIHTIEAHRVTDTFLVPAVIQTLVNHPDCTAGRLHSLRRLRYGAAPITAALLRQTCASLACDLIQVYGMTEATGAATSLAPADNNEAEADRRMRSCGTALAHTGITIRDPDGRTLPPGEVGEICLRSGAIMAGYWRLPAATAEAFHGAWYRSGDAGFLDADGYLFLCDRIKDMIISGGENVYPAEVENALCEHPSVAEVAVIGVPDERWGEAVKAVVVPRAAGSVDESELIAFVRRRIAAYKAPKSVDFVTSLPRNAAGKVLRRELRAPFWQAAP